MKVVGLVLGMVLSLTVWGITRLIDQHLWRYRELKYASDLLRLKQRDSEIHADLRSAISRHEILTKYLSQMHNHPDFKHIRFEVDIVEQHLEVISNRLEAHRSNYIDGIVLPSQMAKVSSDLESFSIQLVGILIFSKAIIARMRGSDATESVNEELEALRTRVRMGHSGLPAK